MSELSSIKIHTIKYSKLDNNFSPYLISLFSKFFYARAAVSHTLQKVTLSGLNNYNTVHVIHIFDTMGLFN